MISIYLMKSIYKKIDISYSFIFVIFLSLISGLFKDVIMLFLVIIIHETGHIFTSLIFKWKIGKISIGIVGGYITYDDVIDKPYKEEILIAMSGFLFQVMFLLIAYILYSNNLVDDKFMFLVKKYNLALIIFNILPIYPLDGSKILNIIFNMFLPYKKSLKLTSIVSFIFILLMLYFFIFLSIKFELSYIMILMFLVEKLITFSNEIPYLFNKFLFERYINPIKTNKYCIIKDDNLSKFKRQKKHIFILKNKQYTEKSILSKRFD